MPEGNAVAGALGHGQARLWILGPFAKQYTKRGQETRLMADVSGAVARLQRADWRAAGLNLEQLLDPKRTGGRAVHSIRASKAARVLVVQMGGDDWGLLYFDSDHDACYRWLERNAANVPALLERVREVEPGTRLDAPVRGNVRMDDEEPLPIRGAEDIQLMLEGGVEKYLASLDSNQRYLVEIDIQNRKGPVLIHGGAGTGKTALGVNRVKWLAERPEMGFGKVLYLCYSRSLASGVKELLNHAYGGRYPWDEIDVWTVHGWCGYYLKQRGINTRGEEPAPDYGYQVLRATVDRLPAEARDGIYQLGLRTAYDEIHELLRPSGITRDEYLEVDRTGMRVSLKRAERQLIWDQYRAMEASRTERALEWDEIPAVALESLVQDEEFVPYRGLVLDEAQDCGRVMIQIAKRLVGGDTRRLYVLSDPAQSIFPSGFRWAQKELGARGGQVQALRTCFRNTRQVHAAAAGLLARLDGLDASLSPHAPTRDGPLPELGFFATAEEIAREVVSRVKADLDEWPANQVAVLAPKREAVQAIAKALTDEGLPAEVPKPAGFRLSRPGVKVMTVHAAKGLDFPVLYLAHLSEADIGWMGEDRARSLLYVGMTRSGYRLHMFAPVVDPATALRQIDPGTVRVTGSNADEGLAWLRSG